MLRPKGVCERLGISYATLREYVKRGPWKLIQRRLSEKTVVVKVSPKNTSPEPARDAGLSQRPERAGYSSA